ncbi:MAG: COR domain-containing protein [Saprospiraceae bacterium]
MNQDLLASLISINLASNSFGNLASEITNQDNCIIDLRNWLKDLDYSNEPSYEVKLILAGNGRVGKTSLLKRFFENTFDPDQKSTHGIQLYNKVFQQKKEENQIIPLSINAWDFGGQEIYHATHRLFMQSRALYLVVWDEKTEEAKNATEEIDGEEVAFDNYTLPYWLNKARALSLNSPLLTIKNKIDILNKKQTLPDHANQLEKKYNIKDFIPASAAEEKLFRRLRNSIIEELMDMPEIGMAIPTQWMNVKRQLIQWKKDGKRTITFDEYESLCQNEALSTGSTETLIRFLNNTGTLFYQRDVFNNKIVLDQKWALDGIYLIFKRDWVYHMLKVAKGLTTLKILAGPWKDYSLEDRKIFLSMMTSCEICFEIAKEDDDVKYLIPEYLPEEPDSLLKDFWEEKAKNEIFLEYWYPFFHSAFMVRFISKAGRLAEHSDRIWKRGIWITYKGTDALIEAFPRNHYISIRVKGKDPDDLLTRIHKTFTEIYYDSKEVNIKVGLSDGGLVEYKNIKDWQEGKHLFDQDHRAADIDRYNFFKAIIDPEEEKGKLKNLAAIVPAPIVISKDAGVFEMNRSVVKKVAKELKELTVEDLDSALNQGRDIINGESDFYNAIIQLNRQLREIKMKKIKDMISEDQATTARNKVADSFMDLMDSLEVEDLLKAETEAFLRKN